MYTNDHEWALIENGIAIVGITYYAQSTLGDVTYVEPPEIGNEVQQSCEAGVIESFKAVSELFAPLSGEVTEVNQSVVAHPEIINQDCYGEGWIFKLSINKEEEIDVLLSPEEYKKIIEGEN